MAIIEFENGQKIEFDGIPTQQDIDEIEKSLPKPNPSTRQSSGVEASFDDPVPDIIDQAAGMTPQQMSEGGHPYLGAAQQTAKDVLSIPANYLNQFAGNLPRAVAEKYGVEIPFESDNPVAQTANKAAGVVGAVWGLVPKAAVGATRAGAKVLPKAILPASEVMSGNLGQRVATNALTGLVGSAAYAPEALDGEKYKQQVAVGTALGVMFPEIARGISNKIAPAAESVAEKARKAIKQNANTYRKILNPGKGEINSLEIKSGKNIDDYFELAAEEGLIIKRTAENKLDTKDAIQQIKDKTVDLNDQLTEAIQSNPTKQFNIRDIREKAFSKLRSAFKNDTEYKKAVKELDQFVEDTVELRGEMVDGMTLNEFKRGMWEISYDQLNPNNKKVARQLGFAAKEAIENAYEDKSIKEINRKLGDFLTLETLLDKANGRVVKGGKLGDHFARVIATGIGSAAGGPVGAMAGASAGGKINRFINNPERITSALSKKIPSTGAAPVNDTLRNVDQMAREALRKYVETR